MTRVLHYTTAGGLVPVDEKPTLGVLQKLVGGYIEQVRMPLGIIAWCDEEGLLKELPRSIIVRDRHGYPVQLHGPVVFVVPRSASVDDAVQRVLFHALPAIQASSTESGPPPSTPR